MADFEIKKKDLLPPFRVQLMNKDGSFVDLTTAVGVTFVLSLLAGGPAIISAAAVIETPLTSGIVRYDWVSPNTDNIGDYMAEVKIVWPGTKPQRAPTNAFWTVKIYQTLEV